jgi:hypothetical protein
VLSLVWGKSNKRFQWSTEFLSLQEYVPSLSPLPSPIYFPTYYSQEFLKNTNPKQFNRTSISLTPENNDVIISILLHYSPSLMKEKKWAMDHYFCVLPPVQPLN